jgi:hypothetical protein
MCVLGGGGATVFCVVVVVVVVGQLRWLGQHWVKPGVLARVHFTWARSGNSFLCKSCKVLLCWP